MNVFFLILLLAMLSVLFVLFLGLYSMVKGGEFNKKYGNKLMRLRVYFQGLVLFFLALAYFTYQSSH